MNYNEGGFLFTGCSFTYGYGLGYYHADYPISKGCYESQESFPHRQIYQDFRRKNRFSTKVTNHYNTFSKQYGGVSGCDLQSLEWLQEVLGFHNNPDVLEGYKIYTDFYNIKGNPFLESYHTLIFQTSYIDRNLAGVWRDMVKKDGKTHFDSKDECLEYYKGDMLWDNPLLIKLVSDQIIETSKTFENLGINVYFIHALDTYKNIPYIMHRTIHITHKETTSLTITHLMKDYLETCIATDPIFGTNPPNDLHPSLECNNSIYKSIVNKLNESNPL